MASDFLTFQFTKKSVRRVFSIPWRTGTRIPRRRGDDTSFLLKEEHHGL